MHDDFDQCLRAVRAKDPRFDGWFVTAVVTTGVYCRPSCPVVPPRPENMRFLPTAAAAQAKGFRACKRCRPDAAPGSPQWDVRGDVVARAVRLIRDGVVDREGVSGLAARLGYGRRHVERALEAELGTGPLGLARAHRAQTARTLIESTAMPMVDVAFAAGFGSVRQFNDTVRDVFATVPSVLRAQARRGEPALPGVIALRLPYRVPLDDRWLFSQLAHSVIPGVEEWRDGAYRRTLRLPHAHGIVSLRPAQGHILCQLLLTDLRDLTSAVACCRRLLDLDADPQAVDAHLSSDPALAPLVAGSPGRRVRRAVTGEEAAIRAAMADRLGGTRIPADLARIVLSLGERVIDPSGTLDHLFPTAAAVADRGQVPDGPDVFPSGVVAVATALARGRLDVTPGADRQVVRTRLAAIPGVDRSLAEMIAMRALGDPDAFPLAGADVEHAARRLGCSGAAAVTRRTRNWRPWRSYAAEHLSLAGR